MPMCAVYGCNNKRDLTLFPKSKALLALWVEKINRQDYVVTRDSRVCSKHFDDNAYIPDEKNKGAEYVFGFCLLSFPQNERKIYKT